MDNKKKKTKDDKQIFGLGPRIHSLARSLDHSILVNAALMALTHGVYTVFLVNAAKKTVYTPWVNAMSAAFTRIE